MEELLKQEGDFIVRFKSDASGQYVLSCRSADKQRHFPIVKQDDSTYRLEGGSFGSIQELVNHHMSPQTPVTKAMMIRNPISKVKDEHDLRHEDILLDTKLGQLTGMTMCAQHVSCSSNKEVPLEDEAWYHGALPRQETEELLKQEGDFIVRFKSDASGGYVLSCSVRR
ncbi:putative tyrosine-protein kinase [Apostichopus japonicus]|uniref:Putative tyrosine-protein kinase n=1 Tax=Stichopus japonicus TaxID=307972 RepID=A0A2G8LCC7_STIJA|nr:putative tyrosine-protein kinase [Apostichopus japonicus]